MFEELLKQKGMNIAQLSKKSGVGYNYIYKIVKNQTDFERCGIGTAKKIAEALDISLDKIYDLAGDRYCQNKIYYQDQSSWGCEQYGTLNAEINKLFLVGIDLHFVQGSGHRTKKASRIMDREIKDINYDQLTEETKCIMVAVLNQQKKLDDFVKIYKNLAKLKSQRPLKTKLAISNSPYNLFPSYKDMNIEY